MYYWTLSILFSKNPETYFNGKKIAKMFKHYLKFLGIKIMKSGYKSCMYYNL